MKRFLLPVALKPEENLNEEIKDISVALKPEENPKTNPSCHVVALKPEENPGTNCAPQRVALKPEENLIKKSGLNDSLHLNLKRILTRKARSKSCT